MDKDERIKELEQKINILKEQLEKYIMKITKNIY